MTHNHPRLRREGTPTADEILDALFALVAACGVGHIRWAEGTRGHAEATRALKQGRTVLQRSNRYGRQMAEIEKGREE